MSFEFTNPRSASPSLKLTNSPLRSSPTLAMNQSKKRRMTEDGIVEDDTKENNRIIQTFSGRRNFIKVPASEHIFASEEWKSKQTLYNPLQEDIMVNMRNIEQVSFGSGSFFVTDEKGGYCGNREGNVIHFWRFGEKERKLYISRSFLIAEAQAYAFIRKQFDDI